MNERQISFFESTPVVLIAVLLLTCADSALADGKLIKPRDYTGSLEEKAQEAILIFADDQPSGEAVQDLILKITVEGNARQV